MLELRLVRRCRLGESEHAHGALGSAHVNLGDVVVVEPVLI
jgi:hypothetical protein